MCRTDIVFTKNLKKQDVIKDSTKDWLLIETHTDERLTTLNAYNKKQIHNPTSDIKKKKRELENLKIKRLEKSAIRTFRKSRMVRSCGIKVVIKYINTE